MGSWHCIVMCNVLEVVPRAGPGQCGLRHSHVMTPQQQQAELPPAPDYKQPPHHPAHPGPGGGYGGYPGGGQPQPFGGYPGHGAAMRGFMHGQMGAGAAPQMAGFSEKSVRRAFIRKVYGILMCQLTLTAAIIAVFMFVTEVKL